MAAPAETPTSVVPFDALPWAELGPGVEMKLQRAGRADGTYTMMNRFAPGFAAPKHLHHGEVHAYTVQGRWRYAEYDWVATAGDYVYEPAGSVHTLLVPEDNAEPTVAIFIIARGMDLYDAEGHVFMTQDGPGMEALYRAALEAKGMAYPDVVLP